MGKMAVEKPDGRPGMFRVRFGSENLLKQVPEGAEWIEVTLGAAVIGDVTMDGNVWRNSCSDSRMRTVKRRIDLRNGMTEDVEMEIETERHEGETVMLSMSTAFGNGNGYLRDMQTGGLLDFR